MSISLLKIGKKSCALLVLAIVMMQVYQVQSGSGGSTSNSDPAGWGKSAYSAIDLLPFKAKAGLAGLGTLGAGYNLYRGKLWLNQLKASKKYENLLIVFKSNYQEKNKETRLANWIQTKYPERQEALKKRETLRTKRDLEFILYPGVLFQQELTQVIKSLGSDSWIALIQGDKSISNLKQDLIAIKNMVEKISVSELAHYKNHMEMTYTNRQDELTGECNAKLVELNESYEKLKN